MKKILQGSEAVVEAAILAGVSFFAGYPITPSSEIAEGFAKELPLCDGIFIQMEDEIASMACIIGASLAGAKAMTATSGPGFSLKQENIGYAIMTETPCVIVNVQRGGPSTGLPTSPAQGDIMQTRWGTHGDHQIISLYPTSVQEAFHLTIKAINFSEKYRTPVVLLMDEVISHMREKINIPSKDETELVYRKCISINEDKARPFVVTEDKVPYFTIPGTPHAYHITGLHHNEYGDSSANPIVVKNLMDRLQTKITDNLDEICMFEQDIREGDELVLLAFGITFRAVEDAVTILRSKGYRVGWIKLLTIWPVSDSLIQSLPDSVKFIIVPELNMGQYVEQILIRKKSSHTVISLPKYDGTIFTPQEIIAGIKTRIQND